MVRPLSGDPDTVQRPTLANILQFISPAGWTIMITSCRDSCNIDTCKLEPTACQVRDINNPLIDFDETVYLDVPNVRIRHDTDTPLTVRMTQDTWVSQAADNESFPCSPFVIVTHNVSIHNFKFATEGCVAQLSNTSTITGQTPSHYWVTTTPVVVATNIAVRTQLSSLQFASSGTVTNRGDAVVRVIPEFEGNIVDLNGSVFTALTGRIDTASPVAIAAALLLPSYTGDIVVTSTRMISMLNNDPTSGVTAWMGSVRTPPPLPPPVVCKTEADLHKTNTIYIIVVSCLAAALVIIITVLTVNHMRHRLRTQQLEKSE